VAEAQQSILQDPVAYEKDHFTKSCDGQVSFGDHFATQQDINNDKLMDIVINEGEITCKGEKQAYCTDEGCPYNFYVQVAEGGYMVLVMKMHPRFCDRKEGEAVCEITVRVRGTKFVTISQK